MSGIAPEGPPFVFEAQPVLFVEVAFGEQLTRQLAPGDYVVTTRAAGGSGGADTNGFVSDGTTFDLDTAWDIAFGDTKDEQEKERAYLRHGSSSRERAEVTGSRFRTLVYSNKA